MSRPDWQIIEGDCRDVLATVPAESVHTCVTSPPYFGLRDYGTGEWEGGDSACDHREVQAQNHPGCETPGGRCGSFPTTERGYRDDCARCGAVRADRQLGLEPTPDEFVTALVSVFREVRRVLRDDGTIWLNLGDSYAQYDGQGNLNEPRELGTHGSFRVSANLSVLAENRGPGRHTLPPGFKRKDLIGIPWMVAFALRADGWYLRSEIIWAKPNPMPESVTDRPTKAHEQIFLLSKSPRYFYDADAIREADGGQDHEHRNVLDGQPSLEPSNGLRPTNGGLRTVEGRNGTGRNKRSVWTVATQPYPGAHFATFPPKLIEPCVLAGCPARCCAACGAPWERVVERMCIRDLADGGPRAGAKLAGRQAQGLTSQRTGLSASNSHNASTPQSPAIRTVGFESSCACNAEPTSGTVLDPFAGAGTTGLVTVRNGRSFVGCELSAEYAAMARDRIETDLRLGHRSPQRVAEFEGELAGQLSIEGWSS